METQSFEKAMERLEEITALLSAQTTGLDDSLALYEEGIGLIRFCNDKLAQAQVQIEKFTQLNGEES